MDDERDAEGRGRDFVVAFARGLDVIQAFGPESPSLTLSEVAARTGVDRAVARRLLRTLADLGFARHDGKRFALTPRVLRLADSYLSTEGFDRLQPALEALSRQLSLNTSLTVLDYPEIVHVARAEARERQPHVMLKTAARMPAVATASGRVLLAALPPPELQALLGRAPLPRFTARSRTDIPAQLAAIAACRESGFAIVDGELQEGFISAAVPLRDGAGRILAALATSSQALERSAEAMEREVLPALRETAKEMGASLRWSR
ncbi:IclR family transcriptional regulator domain-containing protein [Roseomonas populi]|uniref:Helix-turn-helix domain-containing protein n=1 Tax=Roseomonas populi TaxID=3121582 RepID=A0ABT1WZ40_9PROT|nr:IclR family transcriptional regulator C-terminal domain-containing protein [Roseomonas pecuniae]MCR0980724.1 helix-turn-helix domain-containing protein [Roseomonas pecuniae]